MYVSKSKGPTILPCRKRRRRVSDWWKTEDWREYSVRTIECATELLNCKYKDLFESLRLILCDWFQLESRFQAYAGKSILYFYFRTESYKSPFKTLPQLLSFSDGVAGRDITVVGHRLDTDLQRSPGLL